MPCRPLLSCRQFRRLHAEFVDGLLCDEQSLAMRAHGDSCPACSALDVRVRRSLLALQVLPVIEPSADFRARLHERLTGDGVVFQGPRPGVRWGVAAVMTAASVAFLLLAGASGVSGPGAPYLAKTPMLVATFVTTRGWLPERMPASMSAPVFSTTGSTVPPRDDLAPRAPVAPTAHAESLAEQPRFEALPGRTAWRVPGRRGPSALSSSPTRLHLASYLAQ